MPLHAHTIGSEAAFDDMQALVRFGHAHLEQSRFLLLSIRNRNAAGRWLQQSPISSAARQTELPDAALQIAFTAAGLQAMGLANEAVAQFSDEFLVGMSGDQNRSRRLGDVGSNAPTQWYWGHHDGERLHVLLLIYAFADKMEEFVDNLTRHHFHDGFSILHTLPTDTRQATEPFGFVDGISQPRINWQQDQPMKSHACDAYRNLLAPGEIVLGYDNEYGQLTRRPLIDEGNDSNSRMLPIDRENTKLRDLGRNGSYLVMRQLQQNVDAFRDFMHSASTQQSGSAEELAALMVGRQRNGEPLMSRAKRHIPGIDPADRLNHFDFDTDPNGQQCPVGAHIRRSNPRSGDFPPGVNTFWKRLVCQLGFHQQAEYEDLVASSRFHRLLRRGRTYGRDSRSASDGGITATGLQFICLGSNISRQFEFVQSAWSQSASFTGTREQRDPLTGNRSERLNGSPTNLFMQADSHGIQRKTPALPEFVTVRGGGYFFMPGLRAIRYLAAVAGSAPPTRQGGLP